MISLGENYKHSGLIPLKSLGVLPFISMGALPGPYNGCSHLSAGVDAVPFASVALLLVGTWERASRSSGASARVSLSPRTNGQVQRWVTVTRGGRDIAALSQPHLWQLHTFQPESPRDKAATAAGTRQAPQNSSRAWTDSILNQSKERATGSGL